MSNLPYGSQNKGGNSPSPSTAEDAEPPSSSSPLLPTQDGQSDAEEQQRGGLRHWLVKYYERNFGLFLVFLAQIFGSIMSTTTRLLETGFEIKFHALQVIFVRMMTTAVIGSCYLWYKKVPGFPLGPRGVRWLLVLRGLAGSMGLFGLYYSLSYLDIADATVITFLVPTLTAFVCWVALSEPFTIKEAFAGAMAFAGVLFVARPSFLFPVDETKQASLPSDDFGQNLRIQGGGILPPVRSTPAERGIAIACSVFGAFMAATAYATIRVIGKRAHSLVSVNYFAVMATLSSALILLIHPTIGFKMPQSGVQWGLLAVMGISGFLLQVLLTEGLQREKAGRATNLMYAQIVFVLIIERIVWGTVPPFESFIGGALIIGAAIWVSLQKKEPASRAQLTQVDEESRLLDPDANGTSSGEQESRQ